MWPDQGSPSRSARSMSRTSGDPAPGRKTVATAAPACSSAGAYDGRARKRDPADPSVLATAVRETKEEVGLALPPSSLVIRCDDLFARTNGYQVAQLVFALDGDGGPLTPNEEVAAVLWTPLAVLVAPENAGTFQFDRDGVSMELPCVHLGPHVLWGMTYRMLQALLEAVVA